MSEIIRDHVVYLVLRAQGVDLAQARSEAAARPSSRTLITRAEHVTDALLPHLLVFREMVEAAEGAGWDRDNPDILNRARDACAALVGMPS